VLKFITILFFFITGTYLSLGQTVNEALKKLCSDDFAGRGYVENGSAKAAAYLAAEFSKIGLKPLGNKFFQPFLMSVNTFPGKAEISIDGKKLQAGYDFLFKPYSASLKGTFQIVFISKEQLENDSLFSILANKTNWRKSIPVLDTLTFSEDKIEKRYKFLTRNGFKAPMTVFLTKNKLIWSVSREQANFTSVEALPNTINPQSKQIKVNVQTRFKSAYTLQNVLGFVPGTDYPDSSIVICAHYDHLGKMGKSLVFPGANDNASGTAMLLSLASYYAKNPLPYNLVFMAFAAEEAGLVGSKFYVDKPLFPLSQIKFLINLDLVGTGEKGITVVNGTEFKNEFDLLSRLNQEKSYFPQVLIRGKAANSDHYWFTEAGVPSFFIYQMGDYPHYHDPGDQSEILPLYAFDAMQNLLKDFFTELSKPNPDK
jgi:hypothetical protein